MSDNKGRARPSNHVLSRWHWRIGLAAAILVFVLAVTGVLINHAERLGLDERHTTNAWLLDWYGLDPGTAALSYRAGTLWLSWLDGGVYLDGELVAEEADPPEGVVELGGVFALGTAEELLLFTTEGKLVERINAAALPSAPILALGRGPDASLVLQTPEGRFRSDEGLLGWKATDLEPAWSRVEEAPEGIQQKVLRAYRGKGLPWSRVLLDLHSGRILGSWGPYLMDAAALCLLLIVGTGIYNWLRNRR